MLKRLWPCSGHPGPLQVHHGLQSPSHTVVLECADGFIRWGTSGLGKVPCDGPMVSLASNPMFFEAQKTALRL